MTAFAFKIIACITMLIDHIGFVFEEQLAAVHPLLPIIFRLIGRMAFPLFAFGIGEGAIHTSSPRKYLTRMFIFALIAQIPFMLMIGTHYSAMSITLFNREIPLYIGGSVMVTLFLGLCICVAIHEGKHFGAALALVFAYIFDTIIGMDYGILGVLFIVGLYFARNSRFGRSFVLILFAVCFYLTPIRAFVSQLISQTRPIELGQSMFKFFAMCFPALLLLFYNGKQGRKAKLLIYSFYPVHMFVLWLIFASIKIF